MPTLSLSEMAERTGGSLLRGDPAATVRSFDIDTRRLGPGSAFFALCGMRKDGHAFLEQAFRAGSTLAVIQREPENGAPTPPALLLVEDTTEALARCGELVRHKAGKVQWIVVTGSNGKTTTKEMIAHGLAGERRVHRTPGNFNNELGVPLTLLAMPDDADTAVIELAMAGPGEIAHLTRMTDPDVALVTNIRAVHMAAFQSIDDVAAAKGELFAVLRDEAKAVVNRDDVNIRVQATRHVGPQVTFGKHAEANLRLEKIDNCFVPGAALTLRFEGEVIRVQLRIGGGHAAWNALAALASIAAAGGDVHKAAARLEQLEAGEGRGRTHRLSRGMLLVDDSYNSSPPAMASVLETLRLSEPPGRRVLVMGDMLELGPMESALHVEAGRRAAAAGVKVFFGVGTLAREAAESARRAGVGEVHHHGNSHDAAQAIVEFLEDGDLIVVKGSRRMRMERVVKALLDTFGEGD